MKLAGMGIKAKLVQRLAEDMANMIELSIGENGVNW